MHGVVGLLRQKGETYAAPGSSERGPEVWILIETMVEAEAERVSPSYEVSVVKLIE